MEKNAMVTKNMLLECIYQNFQENKYLLLEKRLYDSEASANEVKFYYGKTWKEVLQNKENIYGSDLSFLTPEAIAYYLPAFMIYCIENPNEADNLLDDLLSFLLNLCNDLELYLWREKRRQDFLNHLSSEQKDVIELFVEYMFQNYPEDFLILLKIRSVGK